jgi:aryl-alcohol dehydrogenase-like predicted oxidoreductase
MQLKLLGSTGLKVSRLGLGLAALGRPGYINLGHASDVQSVDVTAIEKQAQTVLDAAYKRGIRYFDAARSYGKAEAFLSSWFSTNQFGVSNFGIGSFSVGNLGINKLDANDLENVVVASKWGYTYTADWQIRAEQHEVKEHTRRNLERQFAESRALLGNHLDVYQIHSATLDSGVLDNLEVLEKLLEIKQGGMRIGLSLSGVKQAETLEKALRIERGGSRLFDTVQATYNLLETSSGKMLELAHEEGMGIIVKEALANGRLTLRNTSPDFADKLFRLQRLSEHYGATLDAFALAFALQQPWADVVLSGATTPEQLASNVKALEVAPLLDLENFSENSEVYWRKRSELIWN